MQLINYRGFNRLGRGVSGTVIHSDVLAAERYLRSIDVTPSFCGINKNAWSGLFKPRLNPGKLKNLQIFSEDFAKLLQAQLPMDVALMNMQQTARRPDCAMLASHLLRCLTTGESLSSGMRSIDSSIEPGYIQVIAIGERAADLTSSFHQLSSALSWRLEFSRRLRAAIAYPALVGSILLLIMIFLITTVVPSLTNFLDTVDQEVSWHTRKLLSLSTFLVDYGLTVVVAIASAFGVLQLACLASARCAYFRDRLIVKVPFYGNLHRQIVLARYTQGLSMLLNSRLDLLDALEASSRLVSNQYLSETVDLLPIQVREGLNLSDAMRAAGIFNVSTIQLVALGELSGDLTTAIDEVRDSYANDMAGSLGRIERSLGPAMMCVVGFFIIWIVLSVVAPIYSSAIGAGALL